MIIPHFYLTVLKVGALHVGLPNRSLFREKLESAFLTVYYCAVGGVYDKKESQPFVPIWMWSGYFLVRASQVVLVVKNPPANAGDIRNVSSIPGSGRSPGGRAWQLTPVFLPGESHGQRSLADYIVHGVAQLDMTEATECACTLCCNCLYFLYQGFPGSSAGK